MKTRLVVLATVFWIAASAAPVSAHHDVLAKYDSSKEFTITGKVTQMMWLNPHASIVVDVKGADGKIVTWQVEIAPPHSLSNVGFQKDTVAVSSSVTVKMWPARDGSHIATGLLLTLPNGKQFDVHDSLGWKSIP